jgi:hypothetical protein
MALESARVGDVTRLTIQRFCRRFVSYSCGVVEIVSSRTAARSEVLQHGHVVFVGSFGKGEEMSIG